MLFNIVVGRATNVILKKIPKHSVLVDNPFILVGCLSRGVL